MRSDKPFRFITRDECLCWECGEDICVGDMCTFNEQSEVIHEECA